jgi:peroxiredoxin
LTAGGRLRMNYYYRRCTEAGRDRAFSGRVDFCKGGHRMVRKRTLTLVSAAAVLLSATTALAAGVKVGDSAPDFKGIVGIDDKEHGLSDFKDAKLVVLVFTCNHCPVASDYEGRLIALQDDYKAKGVQVVAVNVNTIEADRLDKMKERAKAKKFNFPYLYDSSQKIGHDYGATVTPHVFLLDAQRKIAYVGAIDDKQKIDQVKKHYIRDALDALLDGKTPPETVTKQFGCGIQYEKK